MKEYINSSNRYERNDRSKNKEISNIILKLDNIIYNMCNKTI